MSDKVKVRKLYEWIHCKNIHQIRTFLGLIGYFRFMILFYIFIIKSFSGLLKKEAWFKWIKEIKEVLMTIRDYIYESVKVAVIGYKEGVGEIIFMVDINLIG